MNQNQPERHLRKPTVSEPSQIQEKELIRKKQIEEQKIMKKNLIKNQKQKTKRRVKRYFLISLFLFLFFVVSITFIIHLDSSVFNNKSNKYSAQITKQGKNLISASSSVIHKDGHFYLPLSCLAQEYGYVISGDNNEMVITLRCDELQNASFIIGTDKAYVNGISVFLDSESFLSNKECYVPLSFFGKYMSDTSFSINQEGKKHKFLLEISPLPENIPASEDLTSQSLSNTDYCFTISGNRTTCSLSECELYGEAIQQYEYKIDISEYEKFIDPLEFEEYIILVNSKNPLSSDYAPEDLTDLLFTRKDGRATQQLRQAAAMSLEAMLKEAAANGYDTLSVTSGYRSYSYQTTLYNREVENFRASYGSDAETKAAQSVAIPGTSEHQSGLGVDLHNQPAASQTFANTDEYKWLYENCSKFGFILRYPSGKQSVTGIIFEPWHYRFVGRTNAVKIMESGLTLEEYLANQTF